MGLLDDLKQEAERIRAEDEEGRSLRAKREAFYRDEIKPALLRALDFLMALLEQMKVINPEIQGDFHIPGLSTKITPVQSLPSLLTDSRHTIKTTGVRLVYTLEKTDFTVTPRKNAEITRAFLTDKRQTFSDSAVRSTDGQIIGLHFAVSQFRVPAVLEISADIDNQRIRFVSKNIRSFHEQIDYISPQDINQEWLDRLGRYLLAQGESPVRMALDEENRHALQQMIEADKAQREQELAEAERLQKEDEEAARLTNRVRRLLGKFPFKSND